MEKLMTSSSLCHLTSLDSFQFALQERAPRIMPVNSSRGHGGPDVGIFFFRSNNKL